MRLAVTVQSGESARAAVQCGADAVVVQSGRLRRGELARLTGYCRDRGALVFARFSDIVNDAELSDTLKRIAAAAKSGINGALLSDVGLFRAARELLPDFPLFADKRFNACGLTAALTAKEMLMDGVVLNAELSGSELRLLFEEVAATAFILTENAEMLSAGTFDANPNAFLFADFELDGDTEMTAGFTELCAAQLLKGNVPSRLEFDSLRANLPRAAIQAALLSTERRTVIPNQRPRYVGSAFDPPETKPPMPHGVPLLTVELSSSEQLSSGLAALKPIIVYLPIDEILREPNALTVFWENGTEVCAIFPQTIRDRFVPEFSAKLDALREIQVQSCELSNIGHVKLAERFGFRFRAGKLKFEEHSEGNGFEVRNTQTLIALRELGFQSAALPDNLTETELIGLLRFLPLEASYKFDPQAAKAQLKQGLTLRRLTFESENARECEAITRRILS
jgi:hypothetical protein